MAKEKNVNPPKEEYIEIPLNNNLHVGSNIMMGGGENSDTFFKNAFNKLFDEKNPETKTEYRNVQENFEGAVLSFLGNHGNIPYLADFIEQFERKRISLERKGRIEIIKAMVERDQEMKRERMLQMGGMLMGNQ